MAPVAPVFAQMQVGGGIKITGRVTLATVPNVFPDPSFALETNINTSACGPVSLGSPAYCFDNWGSAIMPNLTTCTTNDTTHCPATKTKLNSGANTNAQTILLTPTGNVSPLAIAQSYLPPQTGATKTQIIWAVQPWFAPRSGTGSNCASYPSGGFVGPTSPAGHPCSAYDMSRADVIAAQHAKMIWQAAGAGQIDSPDWYGNKNGGGFLEKVIVQEAADARSRCVGSICPIDIEIMIDKGPMSSLPQSRHSLDLQQILAGVDTLAPEDLPRLLGPSREVEAAAMARLYAKPSSSAAIEQAQLLDVETAAKRLNVSEDCLYRNWKKFPFTHKYDWA